VSCQEEYGQAFFAADQIIAVYDNVHRQISSAVIGKPQDKVYKSSCQKRKKQVKECL
jgi:hypothetical protein